MDNKQKITFISAILILTIALVATLVYEPKNNDEVLGAYSNNSTSSNAVVATSNTTSTLIALPRTQANYRAFFNNGGAEQRVTIICQMASTTKPVMNATSTGGIVIAGNTLYEMSAEKGNLCKGAIFAYSSSSAPSINVYEFP